MIEDSNFDLYMNNTFQIVRRSNIPDDIGGFDNTQGETVIVSNIKGRLSTIIPRPLEQGRGDGVFTYVTHIFFCRPLSGIQVNDFLIGAGLKVRVLGKKKPSQEDHHEEYECEEIQDSQYV